MKGGRELVVILCDSYEECEQAYEIFKEWLERHESWTISRCYDCDNGILTNDGFGYIFVDCRMAGLFEGITENITYVGEFFDEIMTDDYDEREAYKYWISEH